MRCISAAAVASNIQREVGVGMDRKSFQRSLTYQWSCFRCKMISDHSDEKDNDDEEYHDDDDDDGALGLGKWVMMMG